MCPPTFFDVVYEINPWMDLSVPVDTSLAMQQWNTLRERYLADGHTVYVIHPEPGLPDMVYAANGGLVIDGLALAPRFTFPERQAEGAAFGSWFDGASRAGILGDTATYVGQAEELNEGEGDTLLIGDLLLCGTGFRTSVAAHQELDRRMGLTERGIKVITLELVDPRYYHVDTALTVLDDGSISGERLIAYLPEAFSADSQKVLEELFPNAIIADPEDAAVLGLNAVSDGRRVYLNGAATGMMDKLRARGFEPVGMDFTEILKGGGSVKCCTLFLRPSAQRN
ncbi:MAG: N-dimethylarginine dimethylaminohydrolase [Cellulomonadaceae bacterium]|jgi:N-dimethylarginine dimethylaminohydrolase|nr:N-dimethylarginine dimethylaminohydrolase [Cellulomonadaceae bacterium]